ncbi:MAG TPA: class I SAM-dependent methyltransferase [Gaiellaceae bacterium]|nr:class I SAM-dependent methyltransferase [Gaiellaceae bacterium]
MSEYDAWAPVYDAWASGMPDDVDYYVALAREAAEPIVELAAGTGRVAIPIARETGKRVIGIDSSPAMLAQASERAQSLPIEWREADMRDFELAEPVELVICPGRSLLHLPTWSDKLRVFERVTAALRPGGRFAFNAFAFSHTVAAGLDGQPQDREGIVTVNRYAPADNRIDIERDDGATLHLWWATRSEWHGLIEVAGLEIESEYGWFDRRPLEDDSPELVFVTRKPV